VDEKGTVHFTDDIGQVPEKYQDQVKKKKLPDEPASPAPSSPIKSPRDKARPAPDAAEVEKKDILGRGEEWWRDQASEWKQRLIKAQKDYEAAQAALKAKDKELEDAKFKPKSFQRKLQDELKVLEQKVNEQKNQVDEAKNMLEKVLPKQAEEYRADPSWVRIE
jgi:chromosome segregation ATPase